MKQLDDATLQIKQKLLDKIAAYPLDFSPTDFALLVNPETQLTFTDLRELLLRIFDLNENSLQQESNSTTGAIGLLNKISTYFRQRQYYRLIKNGFRDLSCPERKIIVAEGDSWFQFPLIIKDIVDWLRTDPNFAVYSIAYGGDWFTNILYDEKYVEELSIHRPDVFLISGGGNDLLSANRLAIMVDAEAKGPLRSATELKNLLAQETEQDKADMLVGYRYLTKDFYSFIWLLKAQYYKLFQGICSSGKFDKMQIITQGYDYAFPTYKYRWLQWYRLQPLLNWLAGSGKWLKRPLMIKGIRNQEISRQIIKALIFEVNQLFIELTSQFTNVYHVDCRGTAPHFHDWFDELHLPSEKYRQIAQAYQKCIVNPPANKVAKVVS
ncbi:SGNH/GDSL hydrolase family protein [Adhaeribacter swui]|uniref:SGNH/GDSL hydrolase family protein n=1 Tax=Adhaeribacter swui TaxID=2086471 RepID=A0A7G7G9K4_9BACT|nr:SGNH/GDSL hydrolase family protein [Adhaeribacter swui]QNF33838.1 SGNH/GDSL hydrolase family protein [Adhaeribacter swui]